MRPSVLLRPRITEKATLGTPANVYVFEVSPNATKHEVCADVAALYKVTPERVNVVRVRSRATISRMRNRRGMTRGLKKAYVYLKKGDRIELL